MRRLLFTGTLLALSIFGLAQYQLLRKSIDQPDPEPIPEKVAKILTQVCEYNIGYHENFDTTEALQIPHCWTYYNSGLPFDNSVSVAAYPESETSSPNTLEIFSAGIDTVLAISPEFPDLVNGNKMVNFFAFSPYSREEKLVIGTVDRTVPPFNFSALDTITLGLHYKEYVIPITSSNYNGTGKHIALMHGNHNPYSSLRIDDFLYDTLSPCPKGINPSVYFVTDTSAVIDMNSSNNYDIMWGPKGFDQASASITSGSNPVSIHPLLPDTEYEFQVSTNCLSQNNGRAPYTIRYSFRTLCTPGTAPYSNNFDDDITMRSAQCWINTLQGGTVELISVRSATPNIPFSGSQILLFEKDGNNYSEDLTMTSSPAFTDLDKDRHQVRFVAASLNGDNALLVGTVHSPLQPESFVLLDSIYIPASLSNQDPDYHEYIVDLDTNAIPSDHLHVAFILSTNASPYSDLFMDDFHYELKTDCHAPDITRVSLVARDSTSADISWSAGQGISTKLIYGYSGFRERAEAYDSLYPGGTSVTLNDLSPNTYYDVYFVDSCSQGKSYWSGPFRFVTECTSLMAPFYETFDGITWAPGDGYSNEYDVIDNCWSRDPENAYNYSWSVNHGITPMSMTGPSADVTGHGNYIYTHSGLGDEFDTATIMSPLINIGGLNEPYLSFYYHRFGTNLADLHVEYSSNGAQWHKAMTITARPQTSGLSPYSKTGVQLPDTISVIQIRFRTVSMGFGGSDIAIDNISLDEAPSCPLISEINMTDISDTSATFEWTPTRTNQDYEIWFGPEDFYQGDFTVGGSKTIVNGNSITIDTLLPSTGYQILVRAICSPGDSSDYSHAVNLKTLCAPFGAPYFTNFDNDIDQESPYCWDVIERGSSAEAHTFYTTEAYSEPACLYMNNGLSANVIMAISPAFEDLTAGQSRLRMKIKRSNVAQEVLYVGTVSRPFADTNFHPIDTLYPNSQYSTYIQDFTFAEGYNGTDVNIAFKHGNTSSGQLVTRELYIDDLYFEAIPSCPEPYDLDTDTSHISDSTAVVRWTPNGSSSYIVEYGYGGFTPGTGTEIPTTGDSVVVHLQKVNRPYDFYVRSVCGSDTSFAFGPQPFYTPPTNCEGFELYSPGLLKDQSSLFQPEEFGYEFDVTEVTTNRSYTGNQSMHMYPNPIYGFSSSNADIEDLESGTYVFSLAINVTDQFTGNYALIQDQSTTGTGFGSFLKDGVAMYYDMQGSIYDTIAKFNFTHDQWVHIQHFIDLDNDTTWMIVDGVDINAGWQFTRGLPVSPKIDMVAFTASYGFIGLNNDDYYIDDFCIQRYYNCVTTNIDDISVDGCDKVSLLLSDTTAATIEYGTSGFALGSGMQISSSPSPVSISGLEPGTEYDFYSYTLCGNGDTSLINGPFTIRTDSLPMPSLQVSSSVSYGANNQTISLDASASTDADHIVWDFGNGVQDTGFTSSHTYTSNSTVSVIVTAYGNCGESSDTLYFNINIGLEESVVEPELRVYPNPFGSELHISLDRPGSSDIELMLVNAQGQLMRKETIRNVGANFSHRISMENVAAGMYILILQTEHNTYRESLSKM